MDVENDFAAQDLFGDDDQHGSDNDDYSGNVIEEAIETPDPGKSQRDKFKGETKNDNEEQPKKKIIRNPMPKLDPDRICGSRGIGTLSDVFAEFKPKGGDHVFEDLDRAMQKMEHWAHRLYPKLPFDDVMARISVLATKKMAIKTNVKKIRMGMDPVIAQPEPAANSDKENEEDSTRRYDNDDIPDSMEDNDVFEQLIREAENANRDEVFNMTETPDKTKGTKTTLTNEQKERMERNRQLAEEKRRARRQLEETQKLNLEQRTENNSDDEQINFINHNDNSTDIAPLSQVYESARRSPENQQNEIMDSDQLLA